MVLEEPKLNRRVDIFISSSMPMADKTVDGFTSPEPQADPLETAMFAWSNFAKRISERCPRKETLTKPGSVLDGSPLKTAFGKNAFTPDLNCDSN